MLAWIRTSISFGAVGIGIVQVYNESTGILDQSNETKFQVAKRFGKPLGIVALIVSALIVIFAIGRYFPIQTRLQRKQFPLGRISILLVLLSTFVVSELFKR